MNFDRVATVYDSTRGIPPEAMQRVVDGLIGAVHGEPETHFLELGVGTGRIALPLIERGYRLTGVDISAEMMQQLCDHLPDGARVDLRLADITELPFPASSFDVILAVHILHLVPAWQRALAEARRVLKPGGYIVVAGDRPLPDSPGSAIRRRWQELVWEMGGTLRPEWGTHDAVQEAWVAEGRRPVEYRVARWERTFAPRALIDALHRRVFSQTWDVPEEMLDAVHRGLVSWAETEYGDLSHPLPTTSEFVVIPVRY